MKKLRDYPEVLQVKHIQEFLGIGRVQSYELVNSDLFHVVRVGKRILIPRSTFQKWFEGQEQ